MQSLLRYLIQRFPHKLKYQSLFVLCLAIGGYLVEPVRAEGSKELTSQGGNRAFLLYHSTANPRPTIGSIPLRTTIKVYVNAGETINLGSSANGIGSGRINYRSPTGTAGSCVTTVGVIANRTQEVAGPLPNSGGYTPCIIPSAQTTAAGSGVWEIDFVSPNPAIDNNPTGLLGNAAWTQANSVGWVAAWDVTVRNSTNTGAPFLGRVYSNSLALRMPPSGASFSPLLYVQTQEGYRYLINPRTLDPFTFVFFANNNGFKSSTTNLPLYRSVLFPGGTGLESGVTVHDPNAADSGNTITHKLFFNPPSGDLPTFAASASGTTWLLRDPIPPQPTGLAFTGIEGTTGQAGTTPLGGSFSFNSNVMGRYQLVLDLNQDGIYGNSNDRILSGFATLGANTIFWDGRDNAAAVVPASAVPYGAQIVLYAGEIHFPLLDAEQNPSGFTIQRINEPTPPTIPSPDPYRVFFDDAAVGGSSAINGVNSSSGVHSWTSGFGDNKGIDTWTYYPSGITQLNGGIAIRQADLEVVSITNTPTTITTGNTITYTIVVRNNGPSDTTGANFVNQVPAAITGVTWTCSVSPAVAGNSCGAASGSGNNINTTLDLKSGATATYVVTGTVSTAGTITNTARILRSNDMTDPDDVNRTGAGNNSKTNTVTVTAPPVDLTVTKSDGGASFTQGSNGTYTLTPRNNGGVATSGMVTITDALPTQLTYVSATGTGWTCSYNSSTRVVTCTSTTSIAANTNGNPITLTVTANGGGGTTITNTANISGGNEPVANNTNNSGSDTTPIVLPSVAISGSVFHDYSANVVFDSDLGTDVGTNAGSSSLTVYAINAMGQVVDKVTVAANGTYTLTNVPSTSTITLRLSNDNSIAIGATAPATPSLPNNWYHTGERLNSTIDADISTLGNITVTTTTSNLTNYDFGIRQGYVIAPDPAPTVCNPDYRGALNTGISSTGGQLPTGSLDLNWSVEWLNANLGAIPYATARPVGSMPAIVVGNLAPGAWVGEPSNVRWISYPFRLSNNNNGYHPDADFDGTGSELTTGGYVGTPDTVRLKYTASVTLPANAQTISISLPIGVSADNRFMSVKVNGVENLSPLPVQDPEALDFATTRTVNITQGWQAGVNTIEIITDSGPDYTGFFLRVEATTTQVCGTPNLLLVKRITAINGNRTSNPNDSTPLNQAIDDTTSTRQADDNHPNWSSSYLVGAINAGKVKPGDEVEYTIYWLNSGNIPLNTVRVCDRITANQAFQPNKYGSGQGIQLQVGNGAIATLTNADDASSNQDRARFVSAGSAVPGNCNLMGANDNGTIVLDLVGSNGTPNLPNLPAATAPGTPTNSYGLIRFTTKINP